MRLVCPNCGAEYEVDERVIPDAGRDVQCSNCGHAWFQNPSDFEEKADETADAPDANEATLQASDKGDTETAAPEAHTATDAVIQEGDDSPDHQHDATAQEDPKAEDEVAHDHDDTQEDNAPEDQNHDADDTPDSDPEPEGDIPVARALDEGVRDILRQEAEIETSARDTERNVVETQDELGLEDGPAQERMARLRGLDVDDTNTDGPRRDLLPDIEEINSSLAPIGSNDVEDDFAEPETGKSGFSRGFILMIVFAICVVGLYIYAPWVSEKVPALAPIMDSYVGIINQIRNWLDSLVQMALAKLT